MVARSRRARLIAVVGAALLLVSAPDPASETGEPSRRACDLSRGGGGAGCRRVILRAHSPYAHDADPAEREPRRRVAVARWDFVPARSRGGEAGPPCAYSFAPGHGVSAARGPRSTPSADLLFTGESMDRPDSALPGRDDSGPRGRAARTQKRQPGVSDYSNGPVLSGPRPSPALREPVAVVTAVHALAVRSQSLDIATWQGTVWQPPTAWRLAALLRWAHSLRSSAAVGRAHSDPRQPARAGLSLAQGALSR